MASEEKMTINISQSTWAKLVALKIKLSVEKRKRQTFDDAIRELINFYESQKGERLEYPSPTD